MNSDNSRNGPLHLVSLLRGLYTRVARQLGVDISYVSRVARGERQSDVVEAALATEMQKIFKQAANHDGNHCHGRSQVPAKKGTAKKEAANPALASVEEAMAQPRSAKSTRNHLKLTARRS
jgi:hypothetical protein